MNYSLDHSLLKNDPYLKGLKGSIQKTSWMALCAIIHFTKHAKGMDFYSGQYANDIGVKDATMKKALDGLVENKCITVIREYQRKGNIPRRYVCNSSYIPKGHTFENEYTPKVKKVYPDSHKGIRPRDKVKELLNNSKEGTDDFGSSVPKVTVPEEFEFPEETIKK